MSTLVFNNLKSFDGTVSDKDFNALVDAMQSLIITQGLNYSVRRTPAGTTLSFDAKVASGGTTCPFTTKLKTVDDELVATVTPGTVNGLVPSNLFDDFLISDSGTYYVKVAALTDGTAVTSVSLAVDTSEPEGQVVTPFSLPTYVEVLLAIVFNGRVFRTIACGNVELQGHEEFKEDKNPPAQPGELTYTPYYRWANTSAV